MANILVVYGSPKAGDMSASSKMATHFVDTYQTHNENDEIVELRVEELGAFNFTSTILAGTPTEEDMERLAIRQDILGKVKAADKIVLASPMWDFSLPGSVKEVIDAFCVSGETFRYLPEPKEDGTFQEGLLGDKKALFLQSMGGFHVGTENDMSGKLVERIFAFIGITDFTYIAAEGVDMGPLGTFDKALEEITETAKAF